MAQKPATKRRKAVPLDLRVQVLTESGYRCAVPVCRGIIVLDLHHIIHVSDDGGDTADNLIALCPTCHGLYHRGEIARESISAWKLMLVSLNNAFDAHAIDDLIFLSTPEAQGLRLSGDGVLKFSRLIASGFASYTRDTYINQMIYVVHLTDRGRQLLAAWRSGDRGRVEHSLIENPLSDLYTDEGQRRARASQPPGSTRLGFRA